MPVTDNRSFEQTSMPSASSSAATKLTYVKDKRKLKSRAALEDTMIGATDLDIWRGHLRAARIDVTVWSEYCLPDLTGNSTWCNSVALESPDDVRQEAQYFVER